RMAEATTIDTIAERRRPSRHQNRRSRATIAANGPGRVIRRSQPGRSWLTAPPLAAALERGAPPALDASIADPRVRDHHHSSAAMAATTTPARAAARSHRPAATSYGRAYAAPKGVQARTRASRRSWATDPCSAAATATHWSGPIDEASRARITAAR